MHGSATQAALGCIVAALAVAALAAQRGDPAPQPSRLAPQPTAAGEVRALRDGQRLDLNRATADELALIPGIGPKLAERIVLERARRGGYTRVEEVLDVRGVGPKTWQRLRSFVELRDAAQNRSIR